MDEAEVLRRIVAGVDALDPDVLEAEASADVVRLVFGDGRGDYVLSLQRPLAQIWLAGDAMAWHFAWEADRRAWIDRRGGDELFAVLGRVLGERLGVPIRL